MRYLILASLIAFIAAGIAMAKQGHEPSASGSNPVAGIDSNILQFLHKRVAIGNGPEIIKPTSPGFLSPASAGFIMSEISRDNFIGTFANPQTVNPLWTNFPAFSTSQFAGDNGYAMDGTLFNHGFRGGMGDMASEENPSALTGQFGNPAGLTLEYWTWTYTPPPVSAVPEPEEWLLMLFGFGLVGFIASHRKRDATSS